MRLGDFTAQVNEGQEQFDGYVHMKHDTHFTLTLKNHKLRRCNAYVYICGKRQGIWRIGAGREITLERPANIAEKFTFYRLNSPEGNIANANVAMGKEGLVTVEFVPEKDVAVVQYRCMSLCNDSAGTVGLSGKSSQTFGTASRMPEDQSGKVTINLRLIEGTTRLANAIPPSLRVRALGEA